jgi:uncharacterized membrane protein
MNNYNKIAGQRIQRIEAISDGVFAIALTLLILDIKIPVSELIRSEKDLINAFAGLSSKFISYFLSFLTLGIYWSAHSTQFHFISKSDRNLNWINLFFLLFVSLIPFTTAFLSEYITFKFAIWVYWLNIVLLGAMLAINWHYANKHNFISLEEKELRPVGKAIKRRILEAQSLYTLGALLSFINTYISITVLVIIQLNYGIMPWLHFLRIKKENQG